MPHGDWTTELLAPGEAHCHRVLRRLYSGRSRFQTIEVLETEGYGVGLFIDGRIQHVADDEYIYSESLAHPAAILLGADCRRALVVGGGPGGVVRELVRHRTIESVIQVEIDEMMADVARRYFPHIARGCWDDPRVRLEIADIVQFLQTTEGEYDLIIYDISEPQEGSPADGLFAADILAALRDRLSPCGAFVTWAGSVGPCSAGLARAVHRAVAGVFPHVLPYLCHTQSYGTTWLNLIGCPKPRDPLAPTTAMIDLAIVRQIEGRLRLYDGITHFHMFNIPRDVRAVLNAWCPPDARAIRLGNGGRPSASFRPGDTAEGGVESSCVAR
jgi:spermidine synthase